MATGCLRRHVISPYKKMPNGVNFVALAWKCKLLLPTADVNALVNFVKVRFLGCSHRLFVIRFSHWTAWPCNHICKNAVADSRTLNYIHMIVIEHYDHQWLSPSVIAADVKKSYLAFLILQNSFYSMRRQECKIDFMILDDMLKETFLKISAHFLT